MSHLSKACLMAGLAITGSASAQSSASDDPYAWLEDVTAVRSMDWVKAHNAKTEAELAGTPEFQATEYGDPDTADWDYIKTFSPYHLFDAKRDYPPTFIWTTTRDDRVHPAHARKMMAKMEAAGKDVRYFENIEGGHGAGATNAQAARVEALTFAFLWQTLSFK